MKIEKLIEVSAPVERVFETYADYFWSGRWMNGVQSAERTGGRVDWQITTASGEAQTVHGVIVANKPPQQLAWRASLDDYTVHRNTTFHETQRGTTLIDVAHEAGTDTVSHSIRAASIFGTDVERKIEYDLKQFKSLVENGEETDEIAASNVAVPTASDSGVTTNAASVAPAAALTDEEATITTARGQRTTPTTNTFAEQPARAAAPNPTASLVADDSYPAAPFDGSTTLDGTRNASVSTEALRTNTVSPSRSSSVAPPQTSRVTELLDRVTPKTIVAPNSSSRTTINVPPSPLLMSSRKKSSLPLLALVLGLLALGALAVWALRNRTPQTEDAQVAASADTNANTSAATNPSGNLQATGSSSVAGNANMPVTSTANPAPNNIVTSPRNNTGDNTFRDDEQTRTALNSRMNGWVAAQNDLDIDRQINHYAPTLERYYLRRNVSRKFVEADKRRLATRSGSLAITTGTPDIEFGDRDVTMRFRKEYNAARNRRAQSGSPRRDSVVQELKWARRDGEWKIISERDLRSSR